MELLDTVIWFFFVLKIVILFAVANFHNHVKGCEEHSFSREI